MAIFLDDILNLQFTTNLRRGIPVSVKTKGQKGSFRHQGRCGKRCTKCEVCEKGLTATKRGKNSMRGEMIVIHFSFLMYLSREGVFHWSSIAIDTPPSSRIKNDAQKRFQNYLQRI